jgi:hypothetical protein
MGEEARRGSSWPCGRTGPNSDHRVRRDVTLALQANGVPTSMTGNTSTLVKEHVHGSVRTPARSGASSTGADKDEPLDHTDWRNSIAAPPIRAASSISRTG